MKTKKVSVQGSYKYRKKGYSISIKYQTIGEKPGKVDKYRATAWYEYEIEGEKNDKNFCVEGENLQEVDRKIKEEIDCLFEKLDEIEEN